MQRLLWLLVIAFVLITGITSCSPQRRPAESQGQGQQQGQQNQQGQQGQQGQQQQKPEYQDMKAMMLDIIKTDEYQQRLARMIRDPEFQTMVLSQDPKFMKTFQEMLMSSQFQEQLALAMKEKEVKKSIKETVKDAMDDPEVKKKIQSAAKAQGGKSGGSEGGGEKGGSSSEGGGGDKETSKDKGG
ncbi:hypothetical protein GJ688_08440 [Heliobacillus mobilis]|uniref:Spore germination GerD central core domain-containing protein n=1 Tax=Heliobacterium mobile TaxID=28064 RepID=A0A6I3SKD4_HELMO|nr:GerD family protein [Heliobacterium mobile]MTV49007.1 hypothetical protein [Heliobacterium mobile]